MSCDTGPRLVEVWLQWLGGAVLLWNVWARDNCGFNMPVLYTGSRQEVGRKKETRVSKSF